MATPPPFGRKNPRPVYEELPTPPMASKSTPKPNFTSNRSLYACIGAAIAVLVLAALVFS
jgi:hypothetical protein